MCGKCAVIKQGIWGNACNLINNRMPAIVKLEI